MNTRRFTRTLLAVTVAAATLFAAKTASADALEGYVCRVSLKPDLGGGYGDHGHLYLAISQDESCKGWPQGTRLCTQGATSSSCTSSTRYHYTEAQILALFQAAQRAAALAQAVQVQTDASNPWLGRYIIFER